MLSERLHNALPTDFFAAQKCYRTISQISDKMHARQARKQEARAEQLFLISQNFKTVTP